MRSVNRDYNPPLHEAQYCMDLARAIGVVTNNLTPELYVSQQEQHWARAFFRELGIQDSSYNVVIHSGCRKTSPNWSEGKYFQLITAMLQKDTSRRVHILLTALEMSNGFLQQIAALKDHRIHNITPEIGPLPKLISVIGASDALVASSTGPLHLASGLGIKTVGIFCSRPLFCAARWGALGPMAINLDVSEEYCSAHCHAQGDRCAFENGISVGDVLQHLDI
jgi:ADP-heptose:LPS heptosyltransferase